MLKRRTFLALLATVIMSISSFQGFAQQIKEGASMSLQGVDINNKKVDLSEYTGKVLLVSFFTAGCNVCSRDLKLMREFYLNNRNKNFVLLAVNIDSKKEDFSDYMRIIELSTPKDQLFPTVWRSAPEHKDNFGAITRQPTHFVLNAKQQLLFKREGSFQAEDWDRLWEYLNN